MVVLLLEMLMTGWVRWAGDGVVTVAFLTPVTKENHWQEDQIQLSFYIVLLKVWNLTVK